MQKVSGKARSSLRGSGDLLRPESPASLPPFSVFDSLLPCRSTKERDTIDPAKSVYIIHARPLTDREKRQVRKSKS
jgi:hypothetical protein